MRIGIVMAKKDKLNEAVRLLRDSHYIVIDPKNIQLDYHTRNKVRLSKSDACHYWDLAYGYCWMEIMESMRIIEESRH